MRKKELIEVEEETRLTEIIIDAIKEKKGKRIIKIDLRKLKNNLCDYFIICEGDSSTQVSALAENIERQAYLQANKTPHHIEGKENAQWILIDFFDVVVHVFQQENRNFYKLEDLWSDGIVETIENE
ncbi:MAG TPA: ribosome silencing factor [Bacteroidales bacterium]|nr:ribosome silencing factor [Bacteroidales bacterium]HOK97797.1 ribosome silencing factor [Bacteroidales bacterium]HPO64587.1 ribosome silencing factor [Bacteroidales bacterium]